MEKRQSHILRVYFGIPELTKKLLPLVILDHLVTALCLNIPAYFKKVNHLHYDLIGQFISFYYWGCLVGALIGGGLTLYYRSTKISGIGLIFLCLSLAALFKTQNYWLLLFSMFTLGCIGTTVATSNIASLLRSVNKDEKTRLKVLSIDLIVFNLCFSFSTYVLLGLKDSNIKNVVFTLCFFLVIGGIYLLGDFKSKLFDPTHASKNGNSAKKFSLPESKPDFVLLISMVFCFGLIFSMVKVVFTPTLLDRYGSNFISVILASVNPWVVFAFQPLIVDRVRNTNSIWFLGLGGFIVGFSYFIFGNVSNISFVVFALVLLTFGEMMFAPLSKHINIQLYGEGKEGVASGVWKAVYLGSGAFGSEISGTLAEKYGSYIIWDVCGLLGILCFILSFVLYKIRKREMYNRMILDV